MKKTAIIFDYLLNKECEINIYNKTSLKPGQKVTHNNEGQHGGNGSKIKVGVGEVIDVDFQGEDMMGCQVYTANVKWSSGETFDVRTNMLTKVA